MNTTIQRRSSTTRRRTTKAVATGLGIFFLAQGCQAPLKRFPAEELTEAPASRGTVGVYSVGPAPEVVVDGPIGTGGEAAAGAVAGGSIGLGSGAGGGALVGALVGLGCGPAAFLCVPATVLAGTTIGAVSGLVIGGTTVGVKNGMAAIPTDVAESLTSALKVAVSSRDLPTDLRHRTLALEQGAGHPKDLGGDGSRPQFVSGYAHFAQNGIDTLLEINVVRVALAGEGGEDPNLVLTIDAKARLIDLQTGQVLSEGEDLVFTTAPAKASEWMADDSLRLKSELNNGVETLAGQLAQVVA